MVYWRTRNGRFRVSSWQPCTRGTQSAPLPVPSLNRPGAWSANVICYRARRSFFSGLIDYVAAHKSELARGVDYCGAAICLHLGEQRKWLTHARYDAIDPKRLFSALI